jgi:hypothetical protein
VTMKNVVFWDIKPRSYFTEDTSSLRYRNQPVNTVWGNSRCYENLTEDTDTLCAVRTSQETHKVSATDPNRLMLCGETVAVCSENRTEHTDTLYGQSVPHRKHITSPLQSPTG